MDRATLAAYNVDAENFADAWQAQSPPEDLHAIVRQFFGKGATVDIGCGSGREVAWLNATGHAAVGYDASLGMLGAARRRHPSYDFFLGALPELDCIASGAFDNVLCETVLMHLPREMIAPAVRRLADIVKPGGTLYLSWRVFGADTRDDKGRLYTAFDSAIVRDELRAMSMLLDEQTTSASSGNVIHRVVARKQDLHRFTLPWRG